MKKFFAYIGFGILSLTALVIIGFVVVTFLSTRLDISNERLDAREEERSAIEDHWIAFHDRRADDPLKDVEDVELVIEDVSVQRGNGTLEWSDTRGDEGTVTFYFNSDESISFSERRSDLPENVSDYRDVFLAAIEEEKE